jgi:hypothetical protein
LRQNCTVRIGLKSHLRASKLKNFLGRTQRRAWVLTFGQHMGRPA